MLGFVVVAGLEVVGRETVVCFVDVGFIEVLPDVAGAPHPTRLVLIAISSNQTVLMSPLYASQPK